MHPQIKAEMVDEKGLAPEVADRIGLTVNLRGGTSRGELVKFEMSNEVRGRFGVGDGGR